MNEYTVALIVILVMYFSFRKMLKRLGKHAEDVIQGEIIESRVDLISDANDAYNRLIDECGEDFKSLREIDALMTKRRKRA